MVTNVASLGRSGLWDWVLQRLSAVVLALYAPCVIGFLLVTDVTHANLVEYFGSFAMRIFTTLAIVAFTVHAWVGMWTIGTDYLNEHYFGGLATVGRAVYHIVYLSVLFLFFVWTLSVVWGLP